MTSKKKKRADVKRQLAESSSKSINELLNMSEKLDDVESRIENLVEKVNTFLKKKKKEKKKEYKLVKEDTLSEKVI